MFSNNFNGLSKSDKQDSSYKLNIIYKYKIVFCKTYNVYYKIVSLAVKFLDNINLDRMIELRNIINRRNFILNN